MVAKVAILFMVSTSGSVVGDSFIRPRRCRPPSNVGASTRYPPEPGASDDSPPTGDLTLGSGGRTPDCCHHVIQASGGKSLTTWGVTVLASNAVAHARARNRIISAVLAALLALVPVLVGLEAPASAAAGTLSFVASANTWATAPVTPCRCRQRSGPVT